MARVTLPNSSEPGAADAPDQLQQLINDPLSVTMLVFGEGPEIDKVLKMSEDRASVKASIRRVIWIPDPAVLSAEQRTRYGVPGNTAVAVDGKHGKVAETLNDIQAQGALRVDRAFNLAEKNLGA